MAHYPHRNNKNFIVKIVKIYLWILADKQMAGHRV